jgi:hypothetical protein
MREVVQLDRCLDPVEFLLACGLRGMAQPITLQPVPDGVSVDLRFVGDLDERPLLLDHAVKQIRVQAGKAKLRGLLGQLLVGAVAALAGAADLGCGAVDAGLVDEAADHVPGGV